LSDFFHPEKVFSKKTLDAVSSYWHSLFQFLEPVYDDVDFWNRRFLCGFAGSGELFGSTGRKGGKGRGLSTGIAEILNFKVVPILF
jgi:hypothetical protein